MAQGTVVTPQAPAPAAPAAPAAATPPAAASPPAPVRRTDGQKRVAALAKAMPAAVAHQAAQTAEPAAAPPASPEPVAATPPEPKQPNAAQLLVKQRQLERELQQLKQSGEATKGELALLAELRDPAKRYDALTKIGVKYDEWTQQLLTAAGVQTPNAEPEHPAVKQLREELEALKGKHTDAEKQAQQAIAERDHQRRVEYARGIVTEGGEKYALTAALGRHADLIHEHERMVRDEAIDKPDPAVVAANVERLHEQALRKQIGALIATAKGKALVAELLGTPAPAAAASSSAEPKPAPSAPVPTNSMSGERSTNGLPPDFHKWNDGQKRKWAMERAAKSRLQ